MSLIVRISHIRKGYNGRDVLKNCSFTFNKSGIYVLIGPNGSGKSTLLRICALIEKADSGRLEFSSDGEILTEDISLRRRMTLVLPKAGLFNTTVFNNAGYGLSLRGMKKKEVEEKVETFLEAFGLQDKAGQNALTLSSGEAQRLAMARAMAIDPDILYLDEPTASVDRMNRGIIEDIILGMKQKGSPMVIMTTHDMRQAEKLADIQMEISDGVLRL